MKNGVYNYRVHQAEIGGVQQDAPLPDERVLRPVGRRLSISRWSPYLQSRHRRRRNISIGSGTIRRIGVNEEARQEAGAELAIDVNPRLFESDRVCSISLDNVVAEHEQPGRHLQRTVCKQRGAAYFFRTAQPFP